MLIEPGTAATELLSQFCMCNSAKFDHVYIVKVHSSLCVA